MQNFQASFCPFFLPEFTELYTSTQKKENFLCVYARVTNREKPLCRVFLYTNLCHFPLFWTQYGIILLSGEAYLFYSLSFNFPQCCLIAFPYWPVQVQPLASFEPPIRTLQRSNPWPGNFLRLLAYYEKEMCDVRLTLPQSNKQFCPKFVNLRWVPRPTSN